MSSNSTGAAEIVRRKQQEREIAELQRQKEEEGARISCMRYADPLLKALEELADMEVKSSGHKLGMLASKGWAGGGSCGPRFEINIHPDCTIKALPSHVSAAIGCSSWAGAEKVMDVMLDYISNHYRFPEKQQ